MTQKKPISFSYSGYTDSVPCLEPKARFDYETKPSITDRTIKHYGCRYSKANGK